MKYRVLIRFEAEEVQAPPRRRVFQAGETVEFVARLRKPGSIYHVEFKADDETLFSVRSNEFDANLVAAD